MNKSIKSDYKIICLTIIILLGVAVLPVFADTPLSGYSAILASGIIDLRAGSQLPVKSGNTPGGYETPEDLEIGSIFLTSDNTARKVVDIYEYNGKTVIETITPRPEEVFLSLYVPDYDVNITRANSEFTALTDGVTLLPPGAEKSDMLYSDFNSPSDTDKSVTWFETDTDQNGIDPLLDEWSINVDVPLWKESVSGDVLAGLKDKIEKAKKLKKLEEEAEKEKEKDENDSSSDSDSNDSSDSSNSSNSGDSNDSNDSNNSSSNNNNSNVSGSVGGAPDLDIGASGEVRLKGTLRLADGKATGGVVMPRMSVVWIHDWWIVYHPEFHFTDGSIKSSVYLRQQFDFRLTGTIKLTSELKIPIGEVTLVEPNTQLTVKFGLFIKVSLEGEISVTAEVSEYSRIDLEGKTKLVWPFIPVKFTASEDCYFNFGFRPIIAAEAEFKVGLYLGASLEIAGMTLVGGEAGGGGYISANGYMEPMSIMGYETGDVGFYGSFDEWILALSAEAGAYVEGEMEILKIPIPLFEHKWPFWEWYGSWEF